MLYYRVALRGTQSATWRWKSSLLTSLDGVLGVLKLYHCMPRENMRVFLFTSPDRMETMLEREVQGLLSTAFTADQLWDRHRVSWIEVRRLEIELGTGGDHDCSYAWSMPPSGTHALAWAKLLARRDHGEFES